MIILKKIIYCGDKKLQTTCTGPVGFLNLVVKKDDILERHFLSLKNVTELRLLPLIKIEVESETIILSDEWKAHSSFNNEGYIFNTVNHQK